MTTNTSGAAPAASPTPSSLSTGERLLLGFVMLGTGALLVIVDGASSITAWGTLLGGAAVGYLASVLGGSP